MKKVMMVGLGFATGVAAGAGIVFSLITKRVRKYKDLDCKNNAILGLYNKWMRIRQEGRTIAEYLKKNNFQSVAIYGMHYLGENLLDELNANGIEVRYVIDRNPENIFTELKLFRPEDDLPKVDAIIVTAIYFYDEIRDNLQKYVNCPILSIEDIVFELS